MSVILRTADISTHPLYWAVVYGNDRRWQYEQSCKSGDQGFPLFIRLCGGKIVVLRQTSR